MFFVLSGFVLAWNYTDRLSPLRWRAVWSFGVARIARIYPLYLFVLLWALAPQLITTGFDSSIWLHVLAVQAWHPDVFTAFAYNGPAWSVGVEFFLYACFPMLILLLGRVRVSPRLLLVVAIACLVAVAVLAWWFTATGRAALPSTDAGSAHRWLYRTPVTRLGDFVIGIVAAMLLRSCRPRPWIATAAQLVGAVSFVVLMTWPRLLSTAWSWDAAYMLPTFLLLWGLAAGPRTVLSRALGSKPMVLLGEASFAFYLLHVPMLGRFGFKGVDTWRGWVFTVALEFSMIVLVSVGAHVIIERPAQRWLRRALDGKRASVTEPVAVARRESVRI